MTINRRVLDIGAGARERSRNLRRFEYQRLDLGHGRARFRQGSQLQPKIARSRQLDLADLEVGPVTGEIGIVPLLELLRRRVGSG